MDLQLAAVPAVLGVIVLVAAARVAEVARLARPDEESRRRRFADLFRGDLLRPTLIGILLASVPLVGAWAGSKWMIPWADAVGGTRAPRLQSGHARVVGTRRGHRQLPRRAARRLDRPAILVFPDQPRRDGPDLAMFRLTAPLEPSFLPIVFAQGLVATLFFGWLPLYLPELFPVEVRATGAGLSMNIGRFVTAAGVLARARSLFSSRAATRPSARPVPSIYALGMIVVFWAPNTAGKQL